MARTMMRLLGINSTKVHQYINMHEFAKSTCTRAVTETCRYAEGVGILP